MERKLVELGVLAAADVEEEGADEEREESHRRVDVFARDDGATWDARGQWLCVIWWRLLRSALCCSGAWISSASPRPRLRRVDGVLSRRRIKLEWGGTNWNRCGTGLGVDLLVKA